MSPEPPTPEEWAERMSDALLKPLREVGAMLAREVDKVNAELAELQRDVAELGRKVENLAVLAGGDERERSVRVAAPAITPDTIAEAEQAAGFEEWSR